MISYGNLSASGRVPIPDPELALARSSVRTVTLTMGNGSFRKMLQPRLGLDVAGGDLAFVGSEGGQHFSLLTLRRFPQSGI